MKRFKPLIIISLIFILNISSIILLNGDSIFWKKKGVKEKSGILKAIKTKLNETFTAPDNVQASDGKYEDIIRITWNSVKDAEKYYVYRSTSVDGEYIEIGNVFQITFDDQTPVEYQTYFYKVKAFQASIGYSEFSSSDSGICGKFLNASIIKTVPTSGNIRQIAIQNNCAYVAASDPGLYIIDITDPAAASIIKTVNPVDSAHGVAVQSNYAYIGDDLSGLTIIDVSIAASATNIKTVALGATACRVAVQSNYAYVADYSSGLQIVNITTQTLAYLLKTVPTPDQAVDVKVKGNYAYVADHNSGLQIINISNKASASIVKSIDTTYAMAIAVQSNYAYVADLDSGVHIIDISTPTSATKIKTINTSGDAYDIAVSGNYAYVANDDLGLQVIDISSPNNAFIITTIYIRPLGIRNVLINKNYAYVSGWNDTLKIVKLW